MARPKKHPELLSNIDVTVYLMKDQYRIFQEEAKKRGMSLSAFLTYRPDLQENTLAQLRRIYDLTTEVRLTHDVIMGSPPRSPQSYIPPPEVLASSEASDKGWEDYKKAKHEGKQVLQEPEDNIVTSLLRDLREKFAEKGITQN